MHVVYAIDNLGSGGAQRQASALAVELVRSSGVRVSFVVYREEDFFAERVRRAGIPIVHFPKAVKFDPTLPWRIGAWLRANDVSVLHAFLPSPVLWSLVAVQRVPAARRPAVVAAERSFLIATSRLQGRLQRWAYRRSQSVTANCERVATEIHRRFGVPAERIRYIPNGIDLGEWDRALARPCPVELEPGLLHAALVGRMEPDKNHALLIEALGRMDRARLGRWRIWLVGAESGARSYPERIRKLIRERGLEQIVRTLPPVQEIAALIGRLDLVILPSLWEGFPNVVLEAMASGVPVVASPVGDVPNMLEDGVTGLLFETGSADSLAHALTRLEALPEERRAALGRAARGVVEARYTIAAAAAAHLDLYRALARPADDLATAGRAPG